MFNNIMYDIPNIIFGAAIAMIVTLIISIWKSKLDNKYQLRKNVRNELMELLNYIQGIKNSISKLIQNIGSSEKTIQSEQIKIINDSISKMIGLEDKLFDVSIEVSIYSNISTYQNDFSEILSKIDEYIKFDLSEKDLNKVLDDVNFTLINIRKILYDYIKEVKRLLKKLTQI